MSINVRSPNVPYSCSEYMLAPVRVFIAVTCVVVAHVSLKLRDQMLCATVQNVGTRPTAANAM